MIKLFLNFDLWNSYNCSFFTLFNNNKSHRIIIPNILPIFRITKTRWWRWWGWGWRNLNKRIYFSEIRIIFNFITLLGGLSIDMWIGLKKMKKKVLDKYNEDIFSSILYKNDKHMYNYYTNLQLITVSRSLVLSAN